MDPDVAPVPDRLRLALVSEVLHRFGEARVRALGSSMLPALWPGDELTVRWCRIGEARPGEIAVFVRDHRLFAHRVVAGGGRCLVTRGDALPSPDEPVDESQFLGVVRGARRGGRAVKVPGVRTFTGRLTAALVCRWSGASAVIQRGRALLAG